MNFAKALLIILVTLIGVSVASAHEESELPAQVEVGVWSESSVEGAEGTHMHVASVVHDAGHKVSLFCEHGHSDHNPIKMMFDFSGLAEGELKDSVRDAINYYGGQQGVADIRFEIQGQQNYTFSGWNADEEAMTLVSQSDFNEQKRFLNALRRGAREGSELHFQLSSVSNVFADLSLNGSSVAIKNMAQKCGVTLSSGSGSSSSSSRCTRRQVWEPGYWFRGVWIPGYCRQIVPSWW